MGIYILTMILTLGGGAPTSFTVEYTSKQKCEDAKRENSNALQRGASIVMATCTPK